jgi:hypothetical protein
VVGVATDLGREWSRGPPRGLDLWSCWPPCGMGVAARATLWPGSGRRGHKPRLGWPARYPMGGWGGRAPLHRADEDRVKVGSDDKWRWGLVNLGGII